MIIKQNIYSIGNHEASCIKDLGVYKVISLGYALNGMQQTSMSSVSEHTRFIYFLFGVIGAVKTWSDFSE